MSTLALCIPAYNAASYLPRLLTSAASQAIPFNEILVYDDCSTDNTAEVAQQYGATVLNGETNRGCSYGKNQLAAHTTCDWIHFHDADDDLLPHFTKEAHNWIKTSGDLYDVLLLNFEYVNAQTGTPMGTANHNADELHRDALRYAITHKIVNFGIYQKKAFLDAGGFDLDEHVLYNEDNAMHQRLAKAGLKFDYLPEITCINYWYGNSMSAANKLKCERANYHVLRKTAAEYGQIYPREIAEQMWVSVMMLAALQDWEYVKKGLLACRKLGYYKFRFGGRFFKLLVHISPFFALWFREKMIRLLKPHLREQA